MCERNKIRRQDIVQLGRLAATIQRRPNDDSSRKRDKRETLCFDAAMAAAIDAWRLGFRDRESLTFAVAGILEEDLPRSKLNNLEGNRLRQGCLKWAAQFVDTIWFGLLGGNPPSNRTRHAIEPIYRMAFLMAREHAKS